MKMMVSKRRGKDGGATFRSILPKVIAAALIIQMVARFGIYACMASASSEGVQVDKAVTEVGSLAQSAMPKEEQDGERGAEAVVGELDAVQLVDVATADTDQITEDDETGEALTFVSDNMPMRYLDGAQQDDESYELVESIRPVQLRYRRAESGIDPLGFVCICTSVDEAGGQGETYLAYIEYELYKSFGDPRVIIEADGRFWAETIELGDMPAVLYGIVRDLEGIATQSEIYNNQVTYLQVLDIKVVHEVGL